MRKLSLSIIAALGLLLLAACANKASTAEGLTLVNNTIESTAHVTETALAQDRIDVATACKVKVYVKLARVATDAGFDAYITGDVEGAQRHLNAARNVLNGLSQEANALIAEEC